MPKTILHIDSSPLGERSVSRKLSAELTERLSKQHPGSKIVRRDLAAAPPPHLDGMTIGGFYTPADKRNDALKAALKLSDELIAELKSADIIVIGAPMHNFSVPSTLKAWIDHIARAGETFRYGPNGPEGLVKGKQAFVVSARGGVYSQGPMTSFDYQETYLRSVLGFIGVTDVGFITAEGVGMGEAATKRAVAKAHAQMQELAAKVA